MATRSVSGGFLDDSPRYFRPDENPDGLFIGRERELARLHAAWQAVARRGGLAVEVVGPPGIGKTWLLRRFAQEVAPVRVVRVVAEDEEFREPCQVLRQLVQSLRIPEKSDLQRALHGTPEPIFLGRSLAAELRTTGELVIVIDDAHYGDAQSMTALRIAARELSFDPVLFVIVHRASHDAPDVNRSGVRCCT